MRPHYPTRALVLARYPHGEASSSAVLLTSTFGLVRARAQGVRKPGAKLGTALQTFSESDVMLVRGKDGWRLSGALLVTSHAATLSYGARVRAGRVAGLLIRLVHGETRDTDLFSIMRGLLMALPTLPADAGEAAECLAALRILHALGLDTGGLPGALDTYAPEQLSPLIAERIAYIARVNRGITASGL